MHRRTVASLMALLAAISLIQSAGALGKPATAIPDTAAAGVGVVAAYYVTAEPPAITRISDRRSQPLKVGSIVMAGDQVTLPAGASTTIFLSDGSKLQWLGPGTFVVPESRPLGPLAAIFASLPRLFDDQFQISGTAATRSIGDCAGVDDLLPAIEILGMNDPTQLAPGLRDLQFEWEGGCPPFSAQVTTGQLIVAHRDSLPDRQARFERISLPAGRYDLRVVDASGKSAERTFEVAREPPSMPAAVAADTTELGVITGAIWLAQLDGGRWRMESLERLRSLAQAGNPLATDICKRLLQSPPTP